MYNKTAKDYLDQLVKKEPQLFKEPLKKSSLTEADLKEIEKGLGYSLPKPYAEFLQSYQLPQELTVFASFCGDRFACSWEKTFSREKNVYILRPENDIGPTVELEWYNIPGDCGADFLKHLKEEQERIEEDPCFLEAGFIQVAEVYGYLIFLDLTDGKLYTIYHEEIYDMILVDGIDPQDQEAVRDYMERMPLCQNFNDFLRLICTDDYLDEDEARFPTKEELETDYRW